MLLRRYLDQLLKTSFRISESTFPNLIANDEIAINTGVL